MSKKILFVVTNHTELSQDKQTGIWLSEFAEAYIEFTKEGFHVTVASPLGGKSTVDPGSINEDTPQEMLDTEKYLQNTAKLDDVTHDSFDALFLPGGHGTMFDLPGNMKLQELLRDFYEMDKVVAAVCHGPAGLVGTTLSNGQPLVAGKRVNAFTDREEADTGLGEHLPFLLESRIRELGAIFVAAPNWTTHFEADGNLITGQNPQSTMAVTKAVIEKLK
ncbi:type 1 glutamine amidotransferase domain-containing protein [Cytobacillus spongiae]|jgi:putative intracellular protease/amidase|uniref:type 1 glutamine amidotransferase domain-containing protein n=1 Tax=Cytobacillus spongiae TaxID=2901381 RepID=UPI001F186981|nr:type 1 glutamine amidotransferase domain-containing protein [Cytobacillus spongiae]UII55869.1 type 1 glutamine amidotransferase domain-containing protein [Cytobacillus spongiae]